MSDSNQPHTLQTADVDSPAEPALIAPAEAATTSPLPAVSDAATEPLPSAASTASSPAAADPINESAVSSEPAAAIETNAAPVADERPPSPAAPVIAAAPERDSETKEPEPSHASSSQVAASPVPASSPPNDNPAAESPAVASAASDPPANPPQPAAEPKASSPPAADAVAEPSPATEAIAVPEAEPSSEADASPAVLNPSKRSPSPSPTPSASPPAVAAGASASASPPVSSSSNSFFRSIMTAFASLKESASRPKDAENQANKDPVAQASPAAAAAAAAASSPPSPLVPGQPTAAQLALCSQAESALAWGAAQDAIQSQLSPSVRSVSDFVALQMAETEAVQRWIVEMRTAVDWSIPAHHALLERLWSSYACVLQAPSACGSAQSPLSMRAPPFPGAVSHSWKLLGFQGTNPTTDFRGVGLLSLQVLVYLGEQHKELIHVLMSLQNAELMRPREYPLACAGINLVCAVINMLEMDAPAVSASSRNNNSSSSGTVSSLSASGSNFSANPANNSVAPGGGGGGSRAAAKAELQGPAGKFLNQLSATVSEVTRKIKDKLEDASSSDSTAAAAQQSAAAQAASTADAEAAAAAVAAAGCNVRLDPLEDQLNGLLARLGKNRLFRLFVRNKSRVAAPMTEEEAAAAALVSPSARRAAARSPQAAAAASPDVAAPPFRPASAEQLAAIHSIGELLAVLFPLLDDLWVDENANYFDFNRILRSLMTHVGNVLERNPGSFSELSAELKKDTGAVRQRRRDMAMATRKQMGATAPPSAARQQLPVAQPVAPVAAAATATPAPATPTSPNADAAASPNAATASAAVPAFPDAASAASSASSSAASDEPPEPSAPPAEDDASAAAVAPAAPASSDSTAAAPARPATLKSMAAGHALSFR